LPRLSSTARKDFQMDNKKKPEATPRKDDSRKAPTSDSGRQDKPRKHEEAPGRNPAPKRPTVDEPSRGRNDRDEDQDGDREG
jgi:hypothetical protein